MSYNFLNLDQLIKEQTLYLENATQIYQNQAAFLLSQFVKICDNKSKVKILSNTFINFFNLKNLIYSSVLF